MLGHLAQNVVNQIATLRIDNQGTAPSREISSDESSHKRRLPGAGRPEQPGRHEGVGDRLSRLAQRAGVVTNAECSSRRWNGVGNRQAAGGNSRDPWIGL